MAETLYHKIKEVDPRIARRYARLTGDALEISTEGIIRHLRASQKNDVHPDPQAIREVIDDAERGRRMFAEVNEEIPVYSTSTTDFAIKGAPNPYDPDAGLYEISRDINSVTFGNYRVKFS